MAALFHALARDPLALLLPLIVLAATVLAGLVVRRMLFDLVRRWAARTNSHLDVIIIGSLRRPIVLWAVILALHFAIRSSMIPRIYADYVPQLLAILWILSLTIAGAGLIGNMVRFYGGTAGGDGRSVATLTEKFAQLVVVVLGLVSLLKVVFNISLTPILTTLGVGGLAVALALQDTLANLFTGFWVSISGLIHIGDYVKLSTGEEGYITDINWRCTLMRSLTNNLVVIPNSKLGQAIFTNYFLPEPRMRLTIPFSVSYDSDVDRVELVLLDETKKAAAEVPGILTDPPPLIRFIPGPGDFALSFQVSFTIGEFGDQYAARSDVSKRIFKRLKAERITMPYPTSTVILERQHGAGA